MTQRLIAMIALLCFGWGGYHILHIIAGEQHDLEPRRHLVQPPENLADHFRAATVTSDDGTRLACWYAPPSNHRTIIFVHGYAADRLQLYPEATFLQQHGFGAMLCDSRAQGESEGAFISYGAHEGSDLKAIADWLKAEPGGDQTQLLGLGFSMGTFALMHFAARDTRLERMVLEAAPTSLYQFTVDESGPLGMFTAPIRLIPIAAKGVNPLTLDSAALLAQAHPRPLLFVHGEDDTIVPLKRMLELFANSPEPKSHFILPQRGHGGFFRTADDLYAKSILDFFAAPAQQPKSR